MMLTMNRQKMPATSTVELERNPKVVYSSKSLFR